MYYWFKNDYEAFITHIKLHISIDSEVKQGNMLCQFLTGIQSLNQPLYLFNKE